MLLPITNKVAKHVMSYWKRYEHQFTSLFPSICPDVLCLQEVTHIYLEMLEKSDFYIKGNYSHSGPKFGSKRGHSPIIVSKYPIEVLAVKEGLYTVARILKSHQSYIVISAHLRSQEKHTKTRAKEMEEINEVISKVTLHETYSGIFLAGDLNLHFPGESQIHDKYGFSDLWLEKHSHYEGFTWDAQRNSITKWLLPFDNRRMRLDRI